MDKIIIRGLNQNNLKNVYLEIPKRKITVFTGVSGSGKSSIVFDTIAAEASRQMNETYPPFVRSRLPKHPKPACDQIDGLSPCVIIDQAPLGSTQRSTVGTSSGIYSGLRLLFSRIGEPHAGSASFFSFNDPLGMCPECSGMGCVTDIDMDRILDREKSLNEGAVRDSMIRVGSWYWKQIIASNRFDADKPLNAYTRAEMNLLLYGNEGGQGDAENPKLPGIYNLYRRRYLTRDVTKIAQRKGDVLLTSKTCTRCRGKRLNRIALSCWIDGYSIADMCDMELGDLKASLNAIQDDRVSELRDSLIRSIDRMIDIGLGYLCLSRQTQSLSGGEAQRLKLVRYLGSSLTDMLYIFDEPTTGMHPRDVYRINRLLMELRDRGNTVLVVEHDPDMISIADHVIDVGPLAGQQGGEIVFHGSYADLLKSDTITGRSLNRARRIKNEFRQPTGLLPIRDARIHNLRSCDVDIPLGLICAITGVAGSGKSSLMQAFAEQYAEKVIKIDQKPITATNRSTPASYIGIMDGIRKAFADANGTDEGMFSFNSIGACPHCKGKGMIVTELAFMDPIITTCEHCGGSRYSEEALSKLYKGRNILDVLNMTVSEAEAFFDQTRIRKALKAMMDVGLSYMRLGQPLSTLSGGERQRIKLAVNLKKKGNIYLLDEPTTGLHASDIDKLMALFNHLVDRGNSVILIEHNVNVIMSSDYIVDIGPDGGKNGGEIVFCGNPREMIGHSDTITASCLRISCGNGKMNSAEMDGLTRIRSDERSEDMAGIRLNPIGRIESEQGVFRIVLNRNLASALEGLTGFSHIQVLWWFDGCDNDRDRAVLQVKKPYMNGPDIMGTFATRSPERPNPIAVSMAKISSVDMEKGIIDLDYIDADHGSPVLDIKPYTPSADRVEEASVPDWCGHWPSSYEKSGDFDWAQEFNF